MTLTATLMTLGEATRFSYNEPRFHLIYLVCNLVTMISVLKGYLVYRRVTTMA